MKPRYDFNKGKLISYDGEIIEFAGSKIVDKYADQGIENMENIQILTVPPISDFGSVTEIIKVFGSREAYDKAIKELENELYKAA